MILMHTIELLFLGIPYIDPCEDWVLNYKSDYYYDGFEEDYEFITFDRMLGCNNYFNIYRGVDKYKIIIIIEIMHKEWVSFGKYTEDTTNHIQLIRKRKQWF